MQTTFNSIRQIFTGWAARLNALPLLPLLSYLTIVFILWRFVTLDFVETSGDAVWKWAFLRHYCESGVWFPAMPDHHQGRWMINMPVLGLMKLFGPQNLAVYYIYPLLTAYATAVAAFLITRALSTQAAATATFIGCLVFTLIVRESTQFLPMLPAACYMAWAMYCMIRFLQGKRPGWVAAAAILVFLSYACKITSLYWAPAMVLFLSVYHPDAKSYFRIWFFHVTPSILLFSATFLGLIAVETMILNEIFDVKTGQIGIIMGSHLKDRVNPQYMGLGKYLLSFLRPMYLTGKYYDFLPQAMIFVSGLTAALLWLRERKPLAAKMVAFCFLTVYLEHCYLVYKVFPFLHPEKPHGRYFLVISLFALILTAAGASDIKKFLQKWTGPRPALLMMSAFAAVFLTISLIRAVNGVLKDNILTPIALQQSINAANREHLPVLVLLGDGYDGIKAAKQDIKLSNAMLVFYGPSADIPLRFNQPHILKATDGQYYALISGEVTAGQPTRLLVIRDLEPSIATVTFDND